MSRERKSHRLKRCGTAVSLIVLIASGLVYSVSGCRKVPAAETEVTQADTVPEGTDDGLTGRADGEQLGTVGNAAPFLVYPFRTESSVEMDEEIVDAESAVLFNTSTGEIVAYRNEDAAMFPASLTKVMTLIVTVENAPDLMDTVEITYDMVAPMIAENASRAGFEPGDTPTVLDLLYGMILASGADASLAAAEYIAGSETAFAAMMNRKAKEMGLKDTYFTNVTGLHSEMHHSTASDMAAILSYALHIEVCRRVLSTETYMLQPNEYNPEGIELHSTLLSRMYGDEMPGVRIFGGKTGYTDEARNCVESFAYSGGENYILVLAGSTTNWNAIYGTLSAYSVYCAGGDSYEPSRYKKREG